MKPLFLLILCCFLHFPSFLNYFENCWNSKKILLKNRQNATIKIFFWIEARFPIEIINRKKNYVVLAVIILRFFLFFLTIIKSGLEIKTISM